MVAAHERQAQLKNCLNDAIPPKAPTPLQISARAKKLAPKLRTFLVNSSAVPAFLDALRGLLMQEPDCVPPG
jgi:hypothetical protein